jgi:hypothetical protein
LIVDVTVISPAESTLWTAAHNVHRAVPLHPSFLCAMLPWEISKMAPLFKPVAAPFHGQAKKRLIATHPKLEFFIIHSKHTTKQFLIATRIPFSITYFSLTLFTLSPPWRVGRGLNRAPASGVLRFLRQSVCRTRPSRISTDALRREQRGPRRDFTPPATRRMLARGSSSRISGKEPIEANCGGSPCGFF